MTLQVVVANSADLGLVRRQITSLFKSAGVSTDGGHFALELQLISEVDEMC